MREYQLGGLEKFRLFQTAINAPHADIGSRFATDNEQDSLTRDIGQSSVIKRLVSLLVGLSSTLQPASGQAVNVAPAKSERWIIYERVASDGKPLVVVARVGNASAQALLRNGLATVVICRADPTNVNGQGMPEGTDRLYPLEDKLDEAPALVAAGAIRVASVTGQGQRRMYFSHRDPLDLAQLLRKTQVRGFSCDALEVNDRNAMVRLLTPNPLEIQLNGDQDVIASLQKNDDDGLARRKTDFWFYGERRSLDKLCFDLKAQGFLIDHWLDSPTGVVLWRNMSVKFAVFQKLTPIIVDLAEKTGVDYDGWETMVVARSSAKAGGALGDR